MFMIFTCMQFEYSHVWVTTPNSQASELNGVLIVDGIITASSLFLPIRTCILFVLPLFAMLCFGGVCIMAGLQASTILPPFVLGCLCLFSITGAFRNEQHVRKDWLSRREVRVKDAELQGMSAFATVAEKMCDLVLKLTSGLHILDPLALRSSVLGSVPEEIVFTDLLDDVDSARFRKAVKLAEESKLPQCLPVTVRRLNSGSLEAQLMVVAAGRPGMGYVIGIQVLREEPCLPGAPLHDFEYRTHQCHNTESEVSFNLTETTGAFSRARAIDAATQTPRVITDHQQQGTQTDFLDAGFKPSRRPPRLPEEWLQDSTGRQLPEDAARRVLRRAHSADRSAETTLKDKSGEISKGAVLLNVKVGKLSVKGCKETLSSTIKFGLHMLVNRINPCGRGCCKWHIGIETVYQALKQVRAESECQKHFKPFSSWQCGACWAMNEDDDVDCQICCSERELS